MGTIGDCYDNAPMESLWGSMQIELLNRQRWVTVVELSLVRATIVAHLPERCAHRLNPPTQNQTTFS
jgi:transposase InsO family protein